MIHSAMAWVAIGIVAMVSPATAGVRVEEGAGSEVRAATGVTEASSESGLDEPGVAATNSADLGSPESGQSVVLVSAAPRKATDRISLIPSGGQSWYAGRWSEHIRNQYTLGLMMDVPVSRLAFVELEGGFAHSYITYSSFGHFFDRIEAALNGKLYLSRAVVRPYLGAGVASVFYRGMTYGPTDPRKYDEWVGAGQVFVGVELSVTESLGVGLRGAWVEPLFHKPWVVHDRWVSAPRFEEAAAISTSYAKLAGTLTVSF